MTILKLLFTISLGSLCPLILLRPDQSHYLPQKICCEDFLGVLKFQKYSRCLVIMIWFFISSLCPAPSHMLQPHCSSCFPTVSQDLCLMPRSDVLFLILIWAILLAFQGKGQRSSRLCLSGLDTSSGLYVFFSWGDVNKWLVTTDRPPATDQRKNSLQVMLWNPDFDWGDLHTIDKELLPGA